MSIRASSFGVLPDGRAVTLYTMKNRAGASVGVIDYGAIFTSIVVPDRDGRLVDVALGFDALAPYLGDHAAMGDTVGRVVNRIANARFTLDGVTYSLAKNNGEDHIHGGVENFSRKLWRASPSEGDGVDSLALELVSPDGDEGYPGTLAVRLTASWDDACRLTLHYEAQTDKPTHCNLTNHTYFNLAGHAHGTVRDHVLSVESDTVSLVREGLIQTGELADVTGTPLDLRGGRLLGEGLDRIGECAQMQIGGGYDQNYVLRPGEGVRPAARLACAQSGIVMDVLTDRPCIQVYTACTTALSGGKGGASYGRHCSVCLETQSFPDSANNPQFPASTVLRPGERLDTTTVYAFSVGQWAGARAPWL